MARSTDPLIETAKKLDAKGVKSITVHLWGNGESKKTDVDVTADAEKIIDVLRRSQLRRSVHFQCGCIPFCMVEIQPEAGDRILLECHEHHSLYYYDERKNYEYRSDLFFFLDALQFDTKNRVFSEKQYRDMLLRYAKSDRGDVEALRRLAGLNEHRILSLIPSYLQRSEDLERISVLQSLEEMKDVDDVQAINSVKSCLDAKDINTCWEACRVLTNWGHLTMLRKLALQKRAKPSKVFTTHVACWFVETERYTDAVETVRAQGIDCLDGVYLYDFLRPVLAEYPGSWESTGPARRHLTAKEKRAVFLLFADIIEQTDAIPQLNWPDLWDAFGAEFDPQSKTMVKHTYGKRGPEIERSDPIARKEIARALRDWCRTRFPADKKEKETKKGSD
jgi:hypothetical protein